MEKSRRSEEPGVGIYPSESELLAEWLPYCTSSSSTPKPVPVEDFCCSSSSRSSSSQASGSSASFSTLSDDLYDLDEFPDSWLGLKTEQNKANSDQEFYRLCSGADLGLIGLSGDTFSPLEFFSDSVVANPHDGLVDPGCFDGANLSSSSDFVSMKNSTFDDFSIPTCVEDIGTSDALIWSNDEGTNGDESIDEKLMRLLSDEDEYSFEEPSSNGLLGSFSSFSTNRTKATPTGHGRRPGRPRKEAAAKKENPSSNHIESQNQRSKRRRKQHPWKGHHLWEFIRELLENNDEEVGEGEELVRWENKEKGVFLIVNSKEVAELWGKRKHNDTMTYEKLSRSLRWCRTSGFLAEVPKDRKYPKKLCFCFGHRAYDLHRTTTTTTTTTTTMDSFTNE